eukprot:Lankesteria_metandrocarpae@DN835_c0_g1_i1.p1
MSSLKDIGRRRIVHEMVRGVMNSCNEKCVAMVVDERTLRIMSSCVKVYDILEEGISVVELLEKRRQPLPELDAIYFISSNTRSIELLCNDFKNDKKPQYRDIHIFLSGPITQDSVIMDTLVKSTSLLPRIRTFVEFYLSFLPYEARIFHLDNPTATIKLFPPHEKMSTSPELNLIADQVVSLCASIGDSPSIRFHSNALKINEQLAQLVNTKLAKLQRLSKRQTTLLIVDRSVDAASLLVHDYNYQALAYDLINIPVCSSPGVKNTNHGEDVPDDTFSYEFKTNNDETGTRQAVLSESDEVWYRYRHQHITVVNRKVREEVSAFARDNAAAKLSQKKAISSEETLRAVRGLPQFQEMLAKYWVHVSLSERCYKEVQDRKLIDVGAVEQDLVTGVDKDGNEVSSAKLLSGLGNILSNQEIGAEEKLRVLLLYFAMMDGIKEDERRRMMEAAQLSLDNSLCVMNYIKLGIDDPEPDASRAPVTKHTHKLQQWEKERLKFFQRRAKAADIALSRYQPRLKDVMEATVQGSLQGKYPYVQEPDRPARPSGEAKTTALRANNFNWDWGRSNPEQANSNKNKASPMKLIGTGKKVFIFFVIGGITMSEIRCAYEVARQNDCEVYLGSTAILTPSSFIRLLKDERA